MTRERKPSTPQYYKTTIHLSRVSCGKGSTAEPLGRSSTIAPSQYKHNSRNSTRYTRVEQSSLRFTSPISSMAPARRTRPSLTKPKQEPVEKRRAIKLAPVTKQKPVAQRRATELAPVTKNAEEATMTIEEEQAPQEPPVSN